MCRYHTSGSITGVTFGAEMLLLIIGLRKVAAEFY